MKALPLPALQAGTGLGSQGVRSRLMLSPKLAEGHKTRDRGVRAVVSGSRVALVSWAGSVLTLQGCPCRQPSAWICGWRGYAVSA